jgi:hypothetical protein
MRRLSNLFCYLARFAALCTLSCLMTLAHAAKGHVAITLTHPFTSFGDNILSLDSVQLAQLNSSSAGASSATGKTVKLAPEEAANVHRSAFITASLTPGRYQLTKVSGRYTLDIGMTYTTTVRFDVSDGLTFDVVAGECADLGNVVIAPIAPGKVRSLQFMPSAKANRCGESDPPPQTIPTSAALSALRDRGSISNFRWLGRDQEQVLFAALGRIYWRTNSGEAWHKLDLPSLEHVTTGVYHPASERYFFATDHGQIFATQTLRNPQWQLEKRIAEGRNATYLGVLPDGRAWRVSLGDGLSRAGVREVNGTWRDMLKIRGNSGDSAYFAIAGAGIPAFDSAGASWIAHLDVLRIRDQEPTFAKVARGKELAQAAYLESLREPFILVGDKRDQLMAWQDATYKEIATHITVPADSDNLGIAKIGTRFVLTRDVGGGLNPNGGHVGIWMASEGALQKTSTKLPRRCGRVFGLLSSEANALVVGCDDGLLQWSIDRKQIERYWPKNLERLEPQQSAQISAPALTR